MINYNELRDGQEFYANGYKKGYEDAKKEFERPQGEWIMNKTSARGRNYTCTNCRKVSRNKSEFCPKCGAKMMKEAENEDS